MSLDKDLQCREIITKAVCGKGRKFSHVSHTVTPPYSPTSILGAWIINNQFEAVHIWRGRRGSWYLRYQHLVFL